MVASEREVERIPSQHRKEPLIRGVHNWRLLLVETSERMETLLLSPSRAKDVKVQTGW